MRKKALLAEASSPFTGPWVVLEEGEWKVENLNDNCLILVEVEHQERFTLNGHPLTVIGRVRVRGILEAGNGVHLDAKQVRV